MENSVDTIGFLVGSLITIFILYAAQQERQHKQLMRLLSDLAKMIGDGLDELTEDK